MKAYLTITFEQVLVVNDLVVALAALKNDYPSISNHSVDSIYDWLKFELIEKGKRFGGSGLNSNMYLRGNISPEYRKYLAEELLEKKMINKEQFQTYLKEEWGIEF